MNLPELGWTERERQLFEPYRAEGLLPARIAVAYGATFRVYLEDDETLADVTGRMRHDAQSRRDLAANVNVAFLVAGLDRDFSIRRLERYLAMTWESGARPVIVLNKADLADDLETCRAEVAGIAGAVPVHTISSKLGSGIEE